MQTHEQLNLNNQCLVAMPSIHNDVFDHSVNLICQHSSAGLLAIMINKAMPYTMSDLAPELGLKQCSPLIADLPVLYGGPVHTNKGFIIHSDDDHHWENSTPLSSGMRLTSSLDIVQAINQGDGPEHFHIAIGCGSWSALQIEHELENNYWLTVEPDTELVFNTPIHSRWSMAGRRYGFDMTAVSSQAGHA